MTHFKLRHTDWILYFFTLPIVGAGLITMYGFGGTSEFFYKQLLWFFVGTLFFIFIQLFDFHLFKRSNFLIIFYGILVLLLIALFFLGHTAKGAQSWFSFGGFSLQPVDFMKFALILILAKYFSKRHIEIKRPIHIIISGLYTLIPFALVLIQPDFGSALIIFIIWFGMTLSAGLSRKHLLLIILLGLGAFISLWVFVLAPYQKARITSFVNPVADVQGAGYNARQSIVAVGSGQLIGKGVGFGTQSRLQFLPEYQTDFIFAAYAEEWGFLGAIIFFLLYLLLLFRILQISIKGSTNFEVLVGVGTFSYFLGHFIINAGMNIGVMPITGIALPLASYGGSHIVVEYTLLGIMSKIRKEGRETHPDDLRNEFLGLE